MFTQILAYLGRILGLSNTIINLVNSVLQAITGVEAVLGTPAQQHSVEDVLLDTDTIITELNDPTIGLAAIKAEIDAQAIGILAAIAGLPQIGDPVVLPTTPPAGYGYVGDSAIFAAVWNGLNSPDVVTPYQWVKDAGTYSEFLQAFANVPRADGNYRYNFQTFDQFGTAPSFFPVFDLALLDPTDDLLTFVTRCNPIATCFWSPSTGLQVAVNGDSGDGTAHFLTTWDNSSFQALKETVIPTVPVNLAPVWPGIAAVTLGAPTSITAQMTVAGPMDGVIVSITSVSPSKPALNYDTETAYKFIGALAFVDDNGDVETFQPLSWSHALYSPLRMTQAASVVLRTDPSVVGTVTPWVIA